MSTQDLRARLDELVFRYLERVEQGADPARVLDELCGEAPQLSASLRRGVARLRDVQLHPGAAQEGLPDRIGGFRLLRKLGAGGMGVVFLALQDAPRRRVALKLVRPDQLHFDGARERFRREIESAARLSHPGIAAIHEAGESDGLPWFTQEYVVGLPLEGLCRAVPARSTESLSGADLRALLAEGMPADEPAPASSWDEAFFRGSWVEVCLRIARQVADALQHAHERGVLHRDVKPSNIVLTPSGRAVLVDFGLAVLGGSERVTRSGAQVGSLAYMSPEQVDGRADRIGPATDVYSLGVTLYELLTLRTPFGSPSQARLQALILEGSPPSPRRANPAVPPDAATVCLCAMDRDPRRRYPTAAALAADLSSVLARRPTQARPLGPLLRAVRWCQRHPAGASSAVLGFLAVAVAPTWIAVQSARAAAEQRRLNAQLSSALQSSESHFQHALDAVESVMRRIGTEELVDVPGLSEVRLAVSERALAILDQLALERPQDAQLDARRALLLTSRAKALSDLGRDLEALPLLARAEDLLAGATQREPAAPELLPAQAAVIGQRAYALECLGRDVEARARYREALELRRRLHELDPLDDELAAALVLTQLSLARFELRAGAPAEVERLALEARSLAVRLCERAPGEALHPHRVFVAEELIGEACAARGDHAGSVGARVRALQAAEAALSLAPGELLLKRSVPEARSNLGLARMLAGEHAGALAALEQSASELDALRERYPDIDAIAVTRIDALSRLAYARIDAGSPASACALFEEVVRERVARAAARPDDVRAKWQAVADLGNLGNLLVVQRSEGRASLERALDVLDQALELQAQALQQGLPDEEARAGLSFVHCSRVAALCGLGEPELARASLDEIEVLDVGSAEVLVQRADAWAEWALALEQAEAQRSPRALEARAKAVDLLEAAVSAGYRDPERLATSAALRALEGQPGYGEALDRMAALRGASPAR